MYEIIRKIIDIILNPFVFPFIFIGGWAYVSFSLSKKSGWNSLKEVFRYKKGFSTDIENIAFFSGNSKIGDVSYNGLRVGTCNEGIILKVYLPFRIGHPPLFIPWSNIATLKITDEKFSTDGLLNLKLREKISKKGFFSHYAEINLKKLNNIRIKIPWQTFWNETLPEELVVVGNL